MSVSLQSECYSGELPGGAGAAVVAVALRLAAAPAIGAGIALRCGDEGTSRPDKLRRPTALTPATPLAATTPALPAPTRETCPCPGPMAVVETESDRVLLAPPLLRLSDARPEMNRGGSADSPDRESDGPDDEPASDSSGGPAGMLERVAEPAAEAAAAAIAAWPRAIPIRAGLPGPPGEAKPLPPPADAAEGPAAAVSSGLR